MDLNDRMGHVSDVRANIENYTIQMSGAANQAIWQLSGLPPDSALQAKITRLMAACNGEANVSDPGEFAAQRAMLLAWHLEYLLAVLGGPDTHRVMIENPTAFIESIKTLAGELAQIDTGPAAAALKKGLDRGQAEYQAEYRRLFGVAVPKRNAQGRLPDPPAPQAPPPSPYSGGGLGVINGASSGWGQQRR